MNLHTLLHNCRLQLLLFHCIHSGYSRCHSLLPFKVENTYLKLFRTNQQTEFIASWPYPLPVVPDADLHCLFLKVTMLNKENTEREHFEIFSMQKLIEIATVNCSKKAELKCSHVFHLLGFLLLIVIQFLLQQL